MHFHFYKLSNIALRFSAASSLVIKPESNSFFNLVRRDSTPLLEGFVVAVGFNEDDLFVFVSKVLGIPLKSTSPLTIYLPLQSRSRDPLPVTKPKKEALQNHLPFFSLMHRRVKIQYQNWLSFSTMIWWDHQKLIAEVMTSKTSGHSLGNYP